MQNSRYVTLYISETPARGCLSGSSQSKTRLIAGAMLGNTQFLEADTTRDEIFQGDGESKRKTTPEFHARLSRGEDLSHAFGCKYANATLH